MYSHKRMNNQVGIRKILNIEKRNHAVRFLKIRKLFTKTFLTTILTGFGCENIRSNVNNMFTRFYFPVNHSVSYWNVIFSLFWSIWVIFKPDLKTE